MPISKQKTEYESMILERNYLAHELHDSLAQTLASVRYYIRNLDHAIQGGDECEIYELLEVVENNVEIANNELRDLISRFRVPIAEDGMIPAIESNIKKFRESTDANAVFQNRIDETEFSPMVVSQVVRILQEALSNVRKHADAETVRIMLSEFNGAYDLLIEDDGKGFSPDSAPNEDRSHFGLTVMQERAQRVGGVLTIESYPDEGTRVKVVFPREKI